MFRDPRDSTYYSPGRDVIVDFDRAQGTIHLTLMDADVTQDGNQNFHYLGYALFTGHAGELRVNNSRILGDLDGDGQADFSIEIAGARYLHAGDFAL